VVSNFEIVDGSKRLSVERCVANLEGCHLFLRVKTLDSNGLELSRDYRVPLSQLRAGSVSTSVRQISGNWQITVPCDNRGAGTPTLVLEWSEKAYAMSIATALSRLSEQCADNVPGQQQPN
jgi:hypothetical protein